MAASAAYGGWTQQELVAPPAEADAVASAAARTRAAALLAEAEGAAAADAAAAQRAAAALRWCAAGALLGKLSGRDGSLAAPRLRFFQVRAPARAARAHPRAALTTPRRR
jgi:hypothetical protein